MGKMNNEFKRIPDNLDVFQKQAGVVGTYLIMDRITGKAYVGSTCDLLSRKSKHEALLNNNKHHNKKMQKAFNEGADLEFIGVEIHDRDAAYDFEQATIDDFYHSGLLYNRAINARDGYNGLPITEETREKMRISHLGKKLPPEQVEKIRVANTGKKMTQENREQMRIRKTGLKMSDKHKEYLRSINTGKILSEEHKEKIRIANKGREVTIEHRKNLSKALTGRKVSEKTKERLRIARIGFKHTDEAKEKVRIASTGRKMSKEAIEKSRLARIGTKRTEQQILNIRLSRSRPVIGDGIEYLNAAEAARQNKVVHSTIDSRINSPNFPGWYFK